MNIALVDGNKPILGVVYVPVSETSYIATINYGAHKSVKENDLNINFSLDKLLIVCFGILKFLF